MECSCQVEGFLDPRCFERGMCGLENNMCVDSANCGGHCPECQQRAGARKAKQQREAFKEMLRLMPGYPWLPCPICKFNASCDHIAAERARASGISFGLDTVQ